MKTRQGFVSNSSSSSFVIAKCFLTPEQIKGIIEFYRPYIEKDEPCGESGRTMREEDHYLTGETYYICDEFSLLIEELKLPEDKFFWIEG